MSETKLYKIGDLARKTGKTPRALRLYEEMGLLIPRRRTSGGFRLYGTEAMARIQWVDQLQTIGLSLSSIALLLSNLTDGREGKHIVEDLQELFRSSVAKLDEQILRLQTLRQELKQSMSFYDACAECTETDLLESCRRCNKTESKHLPQFVKGLIAKIPKEENH